MRLLKSAGLMLALSSPVAAQEGRSERGGARVLLFERQLTQDSATTFTVDLYQHVVYWVEWSGPGAPVFRPERRGGHPAEVLAVGGEFDQTQRFEVHATESGRHQLSVPGAAAGTTAALRIFRDNAETQRINAELDRALALGVLVAGGQHSGYRLDPTGGADPSGGGNVEGCLLIRTGDRFGSCLGFSRQQFPDAGYAATWIFAEERWRAMSGRWLDGRLTDLGVMLRYAQALGAGPRNLSPAQIAIGLYATHTLTSDTRRGLALFASLSHGRLGASIETEYRDTNQFTAGISWMAR